MKENFKKAAFGLLFGVTAIAWGACHGLWRCFGALTKISDDAVNFAISKLENITEDERKKARSNREKKYLR